MAEPLAAPASPRPRVVFVKSILTAFGGAEHTAVRFACALKARGYAVSFLTRKPVVTAHPYYRELRAAGIAVAVVPRLLENRALRLLSEAARPFLLLPYLGYKRKPLGESWRSLGSILDPARARAERVFLHRHLGRARLEGDRLIVHVFGPEGLTPWIARWGEANGVPVVYTETVEADPRAIQTFDMSWTLEAINRIPLMICPSPAVAANIRAVYGYRGQMVEIPFLIEDPAGDPAERPTSPRVVFGSVGRLVEHKGHHDALWALSRLCAEGHAVGGVVAGVGPLRERLEGLARELGIAAVVRFMGPFGHVSEVMREIDVLVLFSSSEAQPLVITEAMAYGKPVLSTRFGGIPDMVEDGSSGLLVPPGDRDALLRAMRELATDPGRRREMGRRGRCLFLESRSAAVVLPKLEQAYRVAGAGRA